MPKTLRFAESFLDTISRAGLSQAELARAAGVNVTTIKVNRKPGAYGGRSGAVRPPTAWKIAKAYARHLRGQGEDITDDEAYSRLIIEIETGDSKTGADM